MANMDAQVNQAMALFKAGRKEDAKTILMEVVDKDERNEQAWLWLSAMVDSLDEQQICLENVLSINPANERARKGLDTVRQKLAAQNKPSNPMPPAAPPPSRSGGMPIGAEFASFEAPPADSSFDSWRSQGADNSPFGSTSSVDWSNSDAPAAYGSGKNVELPSDQEYESWLQNLNIGGGSSPSFESGGAGQFGDTSFMVDSGPFEPEPPPASSKANAAYSGSFYQQADSPSWAEETSSEPPAPADSSQPFGREYSAGANNLDSLRAAANQPTFGSPFGSFDNEPAEEEMRFDFDDDSEQADEDFSAVFGSDPVKAPASKTINYYQYIPTDIEALSSGDSKRGLAATGGVIVLGLLNLIAVVFLVMGLIG